MGLTRRGRRRRALLGEKWGAKRGRADVRPMWHEGEHRCCGAVEHPGRQARSVCRRVGIGEGGAFRASGEAFEGASSVGIYSEGM